MLVHTGRRALSALLRPSVTDLCRAFGALSGPASLPQHPLQFSSNLETACQCQPDSCLPSTSYSCPDHVPAEPFSAAQVVAGTGYCSPWRRSGAFPPGLQDSRSARQSLDQHVRGFAKQVMRSRARVVPPTRASRKLEEQRLAPRPGMTAAQEAEEAPSKEEPGNEVTVSASEARPSDVQVCPCLALDAG